MHYRGGSLANVFPWTCHAPLIYATIMMLFNWAPKASSSGEKSIPLRECLAKKQKQRRYSNYGIT